MVADDEDDPEADPDAGVEEALPVRAVPRQPIPPALKVFLVVPRGQDLTQVLP